MTIQTITNKIAELNLIAETLLVEIGYARQDRDNEFREICEELLEYNTNDIKYWDRKLKVRKALDTYKAA